MCEAALVLSCYSMLLRYLIRSVFRPRTHLSRNVYHLYGCIFQPGFLAGLWVLQTQESAVRIWYPPFSCALSGIVQNMCCFDILYLLSCFILYLHYTTLQPESKIWHALTEESCSAGSQRGYFAGENFPFCRERHFLPFFFTCEYLRAVWWRTAVAGFFVSETTACFFVVYHLLQNNNSGSSLFFGTGVFFLWYWLLR